jgi:hypothetical protein
MLRASGGTLCSLQSRQTDSAISIQVAELMKLKLTDIGTVIAERQLEGRENGNVRPLTVRIGKPFRDEENEDCWYCPYSIETGGNRRLFYSAGVDSLQALRIAISMIEADLTSTYAQLDLTWMGERDLGFSKQL